MYICVHIYGRARMLPNTQFYICFQNIFWNCFDEITGCKHLYTRTPSWNILTVWMLSLLYTCCTYGTHTFENLLKHAHAFRTVWGSCRAWGRFSPDVYLKLNMGLKWIQGSSWKSQSYHDKGSRKNWNNGDLNLLEGLVSLSGLHCVGFDSQHRLFSNANIICLEKFQKMCKDLGGKAVRARQVGTMLKLSPKLCVFHSNCLAKLFTLSDILEAFSIHNSSVFCKYAFTFLRAW